MGIYVHEHVYVGIVDLAQSMLYCYNNMPKAGYFIKKRFVQLTVVKTQEYGAGICSALQRALGSMVSQWLAQMNLHSKMGANEIEQEHRAHL